jgi:hypothetical protein
MQNNPLLTQNEELTKKVGETILNIGEVIGKAFEKNPMAVGTVVVGGLSAVVGYGLSLKNENENLKKQNSKLEEVVAELKEENKTLKEAKKLLEEKLDERDKQLDKRDKQINALFAKLGVEQEKEKVIKSNKRLEIKTRLASEECDVDSVSSIEDKREEKSWADVISRRGSFIIERG